VGGECAGLTVALSAYNYIATCRKMPLLGVFALEALGLAVDPVSGEVKETGGFIAGA
jgi:hypothetical protein